MSEKKSPAAPSARGLKGGSLGFVQSTAMGVASTAPAYSLAATLGFVVAVVGPQTLLLVPLAFVPMFFSAWANKEMNRADPDCGSSFTWAARALGPRTGWFAGGWGTIAADLLAMASQSQIAGQYFFLLIGVKSIGDDATSPWVLTAGIAWIVVLTYMCYIGGMLGTSAGSHELHYLLEDPWDGDGGLSDAFLGQVAQRVSFAAAPLYAVLHEACYAQGPATRWAAQRVRAEFPAFDPAAAVDGYAPLYFTGEMVYPWMLDLDPALSPLREAAQLLAERDGWPPLYDPARLGANEVPVAAAVYHDDLYVPAPLSLRTAAGIRGLRAWVTNEWEHEGLRVSGGKVLARLIAMNRGEV